LNKKANILFSLIETEHELKAALPVIKEMHIRRWQSHNISSKFLDKRRDSFISEVCKEAVEVNSLFLPVMKIDGVIAAYHIGFRGGNTIFEWNTSFALEFSKWSPGALLMLYILSNAKAWGFSKYNLLRGQEQYKFIWTDKTEQTISVTVNQSEG
jgi:CelD/BcsL family acetyltransferase involved in cellulose biosynthesis